MRTLVLALSLVACNGPDAQDTGDTGDTGSVDDTDTDTGDTGTTTGKTSCRVVMLSPDSPSTDVFIDDGARTVARRLRFGDATEYSRFDGGRFSVQVAEQDQGAENAHMSWPDIPLLGDTKNTLVFSNSWAAVELVAMKQDDAGLEPSKARIQFLATNPSYETVNIVSIGDQGPTTVTRLVAQDFDIPAAAFTLELDFTGDNVTDASFDIPAPVAGKVTNIVANASTDGVQTMFLLPPTGAVQRFEPNPM